MYSDDEYYEEWMMFIVLKLKSMKLLQIYHSFRIIKLVGFGSDRWSFICC
jgi:hypothetical protein